MITNAPDVVKRKSIRLPNLSEVGHLLQGCGIGLIIGHTLDIVHIGTSTVSVIFFCLVIVGGYMIKPFKH